MVSLFRFPGESLTAARDGLDLFFTAVVPALLPFLVCANLLVGFGAGHALAKLASPVVRPLLGVSGAGALPLFLGLMAGYPAGARVTAELVRTGELSDWEGTRLLWICNSPGPLFVLGAVGAELLRRPDLGIFLLVVVLLSGISLGLVRCAFGRRSLPATPRRSAVAAPASGSFPGAVSGAMQTLLLIGGMVVLFVVVVRVLELWGVFSRLPPLARGLFAGLLEMTAGAAALVRSGAPLRTVCSALAAVLAWGGFCIHAQVAAVLEGSGLSLKPYLAAKALHGLTAGVVAWLAYPRFFPEEAALPVFAEIPPSPVLSVWIVSLLLVCALFRLTSRPR